MKFAARTVALLLCLLMLLMLLPNLNRTAAAASAAPDDDPVYTEIRMHKMPNKTSYVQNVDELDVTGGVIAVYGPYEGDDSEENLRPDLPEGAEPQEIVVLTYKDILPEWVSGFDNSIPGEQTLTVTYMGLTTTFNVTIVEPTGERQLVEIWISSTPDKLTYEVGDTALDVTGGVLSLRYNDSSVDTTPLTLDMVDMSTFDTSAPGKRQIGVSYGGFSTSFEIAVVGDEVVDSISLTKLPDKLTYVEGKEDLDVTGGVVQVFYYGEETPEDLPLNRSWVSGYNKNQAGTQTLTVEYGGKTDSFQVTVEHDYESQAVAPTCTEGGYTLLTCRACGHTEETEPVDPLGHDNVQYETPATCTTGGYAYFKCSRCGETSPGWDTDPPLGHAWGTASYVWSEDDTSVAASCACTRDSSHTLSETAAASLTVVMEPTYMSAGEGIRKAVFTNAAFTEQTKTVVIDQLPLPCDGSSLCPGSIFTDMPKKGNWAHDAIDWAYVNGITSGITTTTFVPKGTCIRSQVVTFLWRAAGAPKPKTTDTAFTDIKVGSFYYEAVLWAVEEGITTGTSATTFSPQASCTRGQFVTFLWRYMGEPEPTSSEHPFVDLKPGAFYYKAVLWAAENDVTTGTDPTHFAPGQTCTRAHVVTFLYRALA